MAPIFIFPPLTNFSTNIFSKQPQHFQLHARAQPNRCGVETWLNQQHEGEESFRLHFLVDGVQQPLWSNVMEISVRHADHGVTMALSLSEASAQALWPECDVAGWVCC